MTPTDAPTSPPPTSTAHASVSSPSPTNTLKPDPRRIIVPRRHAQILIEPPLPVLRDFLQNGPPFTLPTFDVFGGPSTDLRQQARAQLASAINAFAARTGDMPPHIAPDAKLILTGHQVEFYHAGVWTKVIAADALAKQFDGAVAIDLLVDHDVVDHMGFDVPAEEQQDWRRYLAAFEPAAPNTPTDGLSAPAGEKFQAWRKEVASYPLAESDTLRDFFKLSENPPPGNANYVPWLSHARRELEKSFGLAVHHVPTSLICEQDAFRLFAMAWVQHAPRWTEVYNRHLAAYRQRAGITNDAHPMPDLRRAGNQLELPFWAYRLGEPRQRVSILTQSNATFLIAGEQQIDLSPALARTGVDAAQTLAAILHRHQLCLRPRALTLTMFARLFLADLFIHGIGGALYDQITDGILQELFHTLPAYACVSAAWLLPLGDHAAKPESLSDLRWQHHHLLHNPQLAVNPAQAAANPKIAEGLQERRRLIEQIRHSLDTARKTQRLERLEWFRRLHDLNRSIQAAAPAVMQSLDRRIATATHDARNQKVINHREWFFPLHPRASLEELIRQVQTT